MKTTRWNLRSISLATFAIFLILSGVAWRVAIITRMSRVVFVCALLSGLIAFSVVLSRYRIRRFRLVFLIPLLLIIMSAWFALTGQSPHEVSLRNMYVSQLYDFQGTRFVWCGETRFGIDCSGLVRTGLWQAMAREGLKERNSRLLGPMLWSFWWHDVSAESLLKGERGYTRKIGSAKSLSDTKSITMIRGEVLKPGDLAVVGGGGSHVMAYVGDNRWIEASPQDWKVVTNPSLDSDRGYFQEPVTLMRWWILDGRGKSER